MQRFCLSRQLEDRLSSTGSHHALNTLSHVYIDDADHIIAVFSDDSEMDVTNLFSEAMIQDYSDHSILKRC
jgi:hypothetical protein